MSGPVTETKTTFCRICEAACGLEVTTEGNRIVKVEPDREHVVTQGYVCIKGIRFLDVHNSPDRIKHPMKRVGDKWVRITWDRAFSEIGRKVKELRRQHGPSSIAMYMGNPAAFSGTHPVFSQAFLSGLGSKNFYSAGSQDCNNKFAATIRMYGSPAIQPIPDFDHVDCFIIVGSNPAISQMSFVSAPRPIERLKAIEQRGGKVYFVNPRKTESARGLGEQVFVRPDTDVYFLLAFLNELIATGGVRHDLIGKYMKNWDAAEKLARQWTPEQAEKVTGIPAEKLREMVARYRNSKGSALYCSTGLNMAKNSTLAYWVLNVINCVSGNLDRRGGMIVSRGLVDLPRLGKMAGVGARKARSRIGNFESVMDSFPAGVLPDEILTPGEGQIRALFVSAGNPLLSCPNGSRMEEALKKLELIVSVDMFRNETGNLAHYILPSLSFFERPDLPMPANGFQPVPYLQWTDAMVQPDAEQRDEWWIYTELARACGISIFGAKPVQAYFNLNRLVSKLPLIGSRVGFRPERMMEMLVLASRQITPWALRKKPHGVLLKPNPAGDFLGKRVLTGDGKIDLAPPDLVEAARDLVRDYAEELQGREQLKLISKRERFTHNSWMHNIEEFVKGERRTNYLYMHPEDARRAELEDGDLAEISSATATVTAPVKITDEMMPRVVALPHGWGHRKADGLSIASRTSGANANLLAADGPGALEKFAGMAHLNGIRVEVRRAVEPMAEAG